MDGVLLIENDLRFDINARCKSFVQSEKVKLGLVAIGSGDM